MKTMVDRKAHLTVPIGKGHATRTPGVGPRSRHASGNQVAPIRIQRSEDDQTLRKSRESGAARHPRLYDGRAGVEEGDHSRFEAHADRNPPSTGIDGRSLMSRIRRSSSRKRLRPPIRTRPTRVPIAAASPSRPAREQRDRRWHRAGSTGGPAADRMRRPGRADGSVPPATYSLHVHPSDAVSFRISPVLPPPELPEVAGYAR